MTKAALIASKVRYKRKQAKPVGSSAKLSRTSAKRSPAVDSRWRFFFYVLGAQASCLRVAGILARRPRAADREPLKSDFKKLISHCLEDNTRGREMVELLKPERDDYFVLKPKHSGFYCTTLDLLLKHLGAETLILTGFATDICILFTANDAFMRDYRLIVPADCVAAEVESDHRHSLNFMDKRLRADTQASVEIDVDWLLSRRPSLAAQQS